MILQSQPSQQASPSTGPISVNLNSTAVGDDYYYIASYDKDLNFHAATLSSLMISLPMGIDTLLDMLPPWVNVLLFLESRQLPVKKSDTTTYHLNLAEKCSFIVGMICIASIAFPAVISYETPSVLYVAFLNANTTLATCPIIAFLTRCTPTWSPIRSIPVAFLICASAVIGSFATLLDPSSALYSRFQLAVGAITTIAFGLYILVCVISFINTVWFHVPYSDGVPLDRSTRGNNTSTAPDIKRLSKERFRNLVIAAHMMSTFANPVWYFEAGASKLTAWDFTIFGYVFVAASLVVYVTEFRVRKSEVTTALVSYWELYIDN
jgi:hypothetical protein